MARDGALGICCQVRGGACGKEHRERLGWSICKDRDREDGRGSTLDGNVRSPMRTCQGGS